jgi:DNA polymerase V
VARSHIEDPVWVKIAKLMARAHRKNVVIAVVNGKLTVKRMQKRGGQLVLMPDNGNYAPLPITAWTNFEIWGVVTHVIHAV